MYYSININKSDYNIIKSRGINFSALVRKELGRIKRDGLSNCIDMSSYDHNTHDKKHRLSVNLISTNPADYYEEDYKLSFVIRCTLSQYADNLRRHE